MNPIQEKELLIELLEKTKTKPKEELLWPKIVCTCSFLNENIKEYEKVFEIENPLCKDDPGFREEFLDKTTAFFTDEDKTESKFYKDASWYLVEKETELKHDGDMLMKNTNRFIKEAFEYGESKKDKK